MRARKRAHGGEGLGRGFHDVVAGGAVNVDVEESGRERGAGEVEDGAPAGAALEARVEMEAMRPSSRTTMGWS